MSKRTDQMVSAVIMLTAIVVGVSVVFRNFATHPVLPNPADQSPEMVRAWEEALTIGSTVAGVRTAPVTIIEMTDLECPYCRGFQGRLDSIVAKYPTQVHLVYVPLPLPMHRFAKPAAQIAECAAQSGKLRQWINAVYAKQDSLGLKTWGSFASDAGLADSSSAAICASRAELHPNIVGGLAFAEDRKLSQTPTILINGWRHFGAPSFEQIDAAVAGALRESEGRR